MEPNEESSWRKLKNKLYQTNFHLSRHLIIYPTLTTILFLVKEIQIMALVSLPLKDTSTFDDEQYRLLVKGLKIFILELPIDAASQYIVRIVGIAFLLVIQIGAFVLNLVEFKSQVVAINLQKVLTVVSYTTPLIALTQCWTGIWLSQSVEMMLLGCALILFTIINQIVFLLFNFDFTLKDIEANAMIRITHPLGKELIILILIPVFYYSTHEISYPIVFVIYLFVVLILRVLEVVNSCFSIQFLSEIITKNQGRVCLLSCIWIIAELCLFADITLVKINFFTFIISLYLFLFWLIEIIRKWKLKSIIIDSDTKDEISLARFIITYMCFFMSMSNKKN